LILKRLSSAWSRKGPKGFATLVAKNLWHGLSLRPLRRPPGASDMPSLQFDNRLGVDTEGIREIGSLDIASPNARHAVRYEPTPIHVVEECIRALPIRHERFSFVDYGAGKGRVLLAAARLPFQQVVGVEFASELHHIATQNLARPDAERRAGSVRCELVDAVDYEPPATPLVCYLYNPFDAAVLGRVLARLQRSLRANPREVYVVYVEPEHRALFRPEDGWQVAKDLPRGLVFRHGAGTGALPD
jgi:hypothetical protein